MSAGFNRVTAGQPFTDLTWNDNFTALEVENLNLNGVGVLLGLVLSAGSGLTLNVSSGVALGSKAVAFGSFSGTALDNSTRYVWLDWTSAVVSGATVYTPVLTMTSGTTPPASNTICLGQVTTLSGAITAVTAANRMELARWTGPHDFQVGQNRLHVDDANARVGVNKTPTQGSLDVQGDAYVAGNVFVSTALNVTGAASVAGGFGRIARAIADVDTTLSPSQTSAGILDFTGTLTAARNITVPTIDGAEWTVRNGTAGGFALTVKTSGGTGIAIAAGKVAILACDGTNIFRVTADV